MEHRNCTDIINQTLELIPKRNKKFINDLKKHRDEILNKPEDVQWITTATVLGKHITVPKEDWEFKVVSLWTTKTIEELKEIFKTT